MTNKGIFKFCRCQMLSLHLSLESLGRKQALMEQWGSSCAMVRCHVSERLPSGWQASFHANITGCRDSPAMVRFQPHFRLVLYLRLQRHVVKPVSSLFHECLHSLVSIFYLLIKRLKIFFKETLLGIQRLCQWSCENGSLSKKSKPPVLPFQSVAWISIDFHTQEKRQ